MADELAGKLALVATALAVGKGVAPEGPAEGLGTRERRSPRGSGRAYSDDQRPRPAADPSGSGRCADPVATGQFEGRYNHARGGTLRREHLEGLDKVTPHHIWVLVLISTLFWLAVFGGYLANDYFFKP